jgi:hypothetical protein
MRAARGPLDWLTFPDPDDADHRFRVNVSFLLSNYRCIWGCGCPGLLNARADSEAACCERGVTFVDEDDFAHVADMVEELTAEDCDNLEHVRERGWYLAGPSGRPYKTRKLGGSCIFTNRTGGPAGKPGCSFHHLAARQGKHPSETKPSICWTLPLNFSHEAPEEPGGPHTTIVSAFTADAWSGTDDDEEPDGRGHMGYWCVDTPDAYRAAQPVYRTFETELRKRMGDRPYERLVELLEQVERPRFPMPGQLVNGGLPMISRLVAQRFPESNGVTQS